MELESYRQEALGALAALEQRPDLEAWKTEHLGKKGPLGDLMKGLKDLSPEEKKERGQSVNRVKKEFSDAFQTKMKALEDREIAAKLDAEWLDLSAPSLDKPIGQLHPLTHFIHELQDIFMDMGFQVLEGPLIEDDWHNFEALNIPKGHPARDMQDTFFTKTGAVLRTHTSSVQIRTMEKIKPPFRGVAPGRVFRCEEIDSTHHHTFHQLEGLLIDKNISVSNMLYFLRSMLSKVMGREVEVRLRHSYFPFVEPGFELDVLTRISTGSGVKETWMELMGCGLVHPRVLKACDIDPNEWSGFAFGMGIERLVMNRYGIDDIRHFLSGDLRFVQQFQ